MFGWPLLFTPMHIAFLEIVIDPVCSIAFEAEDEERDVMQRPPRDPGARAVKLADGRVLIAGGYDNSGALATAEIYDPATGTFSATGNLPEARGDHALAPLADRIHAAFLYGSIAKGNDTTRSDIDLMVVADDLTYAEVMLALHPVAERLGRQINPTVYDRDELRNRIEGSNSFVTRVLEQPRQWLIGGNDDLAA